MLSLKLMVAAVFRITTASARVTAAERDSGGVVSVKARWRGAAGAVHGAVLRPRRDRGFAQYPEQRGERVVDGAGGLAAHERHALAFGECVGVVALPLGDPSGAHAPVVWALRLLAARREAEDFGAESLLGVAEGEGAAVGGGGRAALMLILHGHTGTQGAFP